MLQLNVENGFIFNESFKCERELEILYSIYRDLNNFIVFLKKYDLIIFKNFQDYEFNC